VSEEPPPTDPVAELLGEVPGLTAEQVAERAGMPVEQARRLWRILGFPEHGDAPAYTTADVASLRSVVRILGDGIVDLDVVYNVARGVGLTMARLAEWEVGTLVQRLDEVYAASGSPEDGDAATWLMHKYGAAFEELLIYSWRRHLAASLARMESVRAIDDDPRSTDLTVGFADIVGFTALSNELSRDRIGDLVELFESRCGDVISAQRGRLIKSMGDAVLFVNDDPLRAFATAEGIINVIGRDSRMPDVRVGLATGSVVLRLGDVFGPPVNLASRLTNVARRNRIIVDATTAELLPSDQIESRPLPARPVRGFGIVEPVTARRL
jgi:adenylate cyclase